MIIHSDCALWSINQLVDGSWNFEVKLNWRMSGIYIAILFTGSRPQISDSDFKITQREEVRFSLRNIDFLFRYNPNHIGHVSAQHLHHKKAKYLNLSTTTFDLVWHGIFYKCVPLIRSSSQARRLRLTQSTLSHLVAEQKPDVASLSLIRLLIIFWSSSARMFTFSPRLRYSHIGIAEPELPWIKNAQATSSEQHNSFDAISSSFRFFSLVILLGTSLDN